MFREFMLEEIVTVVDASSRDAVLELSKTLGLNNFPVPSFLRALSPALSEKDKDMVQQIRVLIQFLFGDLDLGNNGNNQRVQELLPVAREYASQLRDYGGLLVVRLTEKSISRGLKWASGPPAPVR